MAAFKFRISQRKGKKYDALFADGRVVSFGGLRGDGKPYGQYKDRTSLKAYSAYDHKDKKDVKHITLVMGLSMRKIHTQPTGFQKNIFGNYIQWVACQVKSSELI
jgi:hypothetical protein